MKPQIIISDLTCGHHNGNLDLSISRITKGGSWKKQRVIMIIPSGDLIPAKVYLSHCSLIFPPNQGAAKLLALGQEVGDAYSNIIEQILSHPELNQWEYLLTIEADNIPPADGVLKLIERMEAHSEFHCIGGLYWCKGEGGCAHIWGDINDPIQNYRPQIPKHNELIECYGTSMGFNLWRLSLFKDERLKKPWFKTIAGLEGIGTQDLAFWNDAKKYGYRCAVDCSVLVGHHDHEGKFGIPDMTW